MFLDSFDKRTSTLIKTAVVLFAVLVCIGCASAPTKPVTANTRELTDDAGRVIALPTKVERVISLAPNLTEIVFAIGAGSTLVGRTKYCDYPAEAKSVEEVGDTLHPSLEKIIALKPQVVLVSTASQLEVFTEQLKAHDIGVFVTDPNDLGGVFRSILKVGEIVDHIEQARTLVDRLSKRASAVEAAVKPFPRIRTFYQLSAEPLYTAGKDSFATDLMRRAGADSVTGDVPGAWPKFSAETALAAKPEAIILPTGASMGEGNSFVAEALKNSPAVQHGKVYKINDDHLVRPGPRAVDGLEEMARALHPEAFSR